MRRRSPNGLVELSAPASVRAGSRFDISGRVEGERGGRIDLRDPAGALIAQSASADDGAFAFSAQAKSAGTADFSLRVFDRNGTSIEDLALPVSVRSGAICACSLLAGAPDPDLKYLRRWAADAGVQLTSRIALSDGVAIADGAAALTPDSLARTDIVIADERAWKTLDAHAKASLTDAVARWARPFSAHHRDRCRTTSRRNGAVSDSMCARRTSHKRCHSSSEAARRRQLRSSRGAPIRSMRVDATPLLRAGDGSALALWRAEGEGRVAVWWLADSYRLALGGDPGAFGTLWSEALETVARARGTATPDLPGEARVDQRSVICGLGDDAFVEQPDAKHVALTIDTDRGTTRLRGVLAFATPAGTRSSPGGTRWPFRVRDAKDGASLARARDADATRMLAGRPLAESSSATRSIPAPRWPFFLAVAARDDRTLVARAHACARRRYRRRERHGTAPAVLGLIRRRMDDFDPCREGRSALVVMFRQGICDAWLTFPTGADGTLVA